MRSIWIIIHVCLSLLFITAPILGISAERTLIENEEMTCCSSDHTDDEMMCCHLDDVEKTHDTSKSSCQDTCHDHATHVLTHTFQPPNQQVQALNSAFICSLKIPSYFQDLSQQQFDFQFWNPPKFV